MKTNGGRGRRAEQKKRRKKRLKLVPKTKGLYLCIDGNLTNHPLAFCEYHQGVLTLGLMETHRCRERQCYRLKEGGCFE